jgi:hypothetical protein
VVSVDEEEEEEEEGVDLMDSLAVSLGRWSSASAVGSYKSLSCGHSFAES